MRAQHTRTHTTHYLIFPISLSAGDPLLWVPEDQAVHDGHGSVRRLLSERGVGRRGALPPPVRHHRDQDVQQHVHVPRLARSQTHLPRRKVSGVRVCGGVRAEGVCVYVWGECGCACVLGLG